MLGRPGNIAMNWKRYSNPFVIYSQHLPVLRSIELALEGLHRISAGPSRLNWISPGEEGERESRGNFLSNYSEVEKAGTA